MRSITVTRGNLFQIAAQYLGDATMWIYLAQLNQIKDPSIQAVTVLTLPAASNLQGGGIVIQ
ncbi:MAG: hypothetical protein P4L71_08500 [Acetobacteraceae bacterium]|nr:hypothetical protein [Acetobacteraceae bacterium]